MNLPSASECQAFVEKLQQDLLPYKELANVRDSELTVMSAIAVHYSKIFLDDLRARGVNFNTPLDDLTNTLNQEDLKQIAQNFLSMIVLMEITYVYGRIDERRNQMEELISQTGN